jgi:hypothetical protein
VSQSGTRTDSDQTPALATIPAQRSPADDPIPAPPAAEPARTGFGWRAAVLAMSLYTALRLLCLAAAWFFATEQHRDLWGLLRKYDAGWYAQIANHGYDSVVTMKPDGSMGLTNLAFFPLLPGLSALLDPILPGGAGSAGILISWLFGAVAAAGLYAVGSHLRDRTTGVMLAAVWAVIPHGFVESMGYSETLFTALAAWSLYALLRRQWLVAGLLCLLAGLTRPSAAALILVVMLSALVAAVRRRDGWRPWVAAVLAPLGFLGYLAWVGDRLGRWDGYFLVQRDAWRMSYDFGAYTVDTIHGLLTTPGPLALYVVILVLLVALGLTAILIVDRWPWQIWLYTLVFFAMAFFGDSYFNSKARYLIPAFTLLLPVAAALAKTRRAVAVVVLTVMTLLSAGYGAYLCLVWTHSP